MLLRLLPLALAAVSPANAGHEFADRDLAAGQAVYAENCASCHGADLEGAPDWQTRNPDGTMPAPPHDASGHTWHHDTPLLFDYTKLGGEGALARRGITGVQRAMPAFGDSLSDADIWNVLAYIQSTWPAEIQEVQAARSPGH